MRKAATLLVIGLLGATAWQYRPAEDVTVFPGSPEPIPVNAVACVGEIERTTRPVLQIIPAGAMRMIVAGGGKVIHDQVVANLDPVPLESLIPAGAGVIGIEFTGDGGGGVMVSPGEASLLASVCPPPILATGGLTAFSTDSEESATLYLANPYASDAEVGIVSSTEQGSDTVTAFDSIHIPARSVVTRDVSGLLRLRRIVSLVFENRRGAFHAVVVQRGGGDAMAIEAVPGATEWFVPVMSSGPSNILVAPTTQQPTSVEIERFDGSRQTVFEGVIPTGTHLELDDVIKGEGPGLLRVTSTAPVVVGMSIFGDTYRAGGPGVSRLGYEWQAVGGDGRRLTLLILNPNEFEGELKISHGTREITRTIPAESMMEIPLLWEGFAVVESSAAVAVSWTIEGPGLAMANAYTNSDWD